MPFAPNGATAIETRTIIACALIVLLVAAGAAAIFWLRYNRHDRRIQRQRDREAAHRNDLPPGS